MTSSRIRQQPLIARYGIVSTLGGMSIFESPDATAKRVFPSAERTSPFSARHFGFAAEIVNFVRLRHPRNAPWHHPSVPSYLAGKCKDDNATSPSNGACILSVTDPSSMTTESSLSQAANDPYSRLRTFLPTNADLSFGHFLKTLQRTNPDKIRTDSRFGHPANALLPRCICHRRGWRTKSFRRWKARAVRGGTPSSGCHSDGV